MTIANIQTLARLLTRTDTTSYTAAQLLIATNASYERITGKIITETAGGSMPHGDLNYTAFPTFPVTMTNSTAEYDLRDWLTAEDSGSTSANSFPLVILGAEVLDNTGIWHPLSRTSFREIRGSGIAQPEYHKTDGQPKEYELRDNLLVLYPAPDNGVTVTLTNGLRLYYLHTADLFTSSEVTTGTKEPGFPSPWHDIIAYEAAYTYAISVSPPLDNAQYLLKEVQRKEKELFNFIGKRDQDSRPIMSGKGINYI